MTPLQAFAEPDQFTSHSSNPYASPDNRDGYKPDWTLFRRVICGFAVLGVLFFSVDCVCLAHFRTLRIQRSPVDEFVSFLTDWVPTAPKSSPQSSLKSTPYRSSSSSP